MIKWKQIEGFPRVLEGYVGDKTVAFLGHLWLWDVAGKAVRGYSVGVYRGDDYRSVGYYPRTLKEAKACAENYYALLNN